MGIAKPVVDVVRKVWVEDEPSFLEIRPYPEAPDNALEIATTSDKSIEWFGKVSLPISKEYARALGEALIAASKE